MSTVPMITDDIFGPIFDGSLLTRSVLATLQLWLPTYLRELELQRGLEPKCTPLPKTYAERWKFDSYPDDKIPAVIVVSPGMMEAPKMDGDGTMNGWWAIGVGIICAASTEDNSERVAKLYGGACRLILSQKGSLDETWEYNGCRIMDETYTEIPDINQSRTMRTAHVIGQIQVLNMWNKWAGPAHPDAPDPETQPGSQWPEVETVYTDIERLEEE